MKALLLLLMVASTASADSPYWHPRYGKPYRDPAVARRFSQTHICPSTGRTGPCPGYIRDHRIPLACGGADAEWNLQYQTIEQAKAKDQWELGMCGKHRR